MEQEMAKNGRPFLLLSAQVFMIEMPSISHLAQQHVALEQIHTRCTARCYSLSDSVKEMLPHL